MAECGEAQTRLAGERLDYERALEQTVLESSVLQQLLDTDIPNVTKLRKTLAKLTLDMDASRSRLEGRGEGKERGGRRREWWSGDRG